MYAVAEKKLNITLKPLSHPELGKILVEESLFPIGRNEAPFSSYPRDLVTALSRRHARIFKENNRVYLADLGSQNGTTINGNPICNTPIELHAGDQVCFAGILTYQADIVQYDSPHAAPESTTPSIRLTLVPQRTDISLDPVVVSQLPFLVGKTNEVFLQYKDQYPQEVNFLSRRHAHFFLKEGDLYIEDLGSTNGTFVSGNRLDEHAKRLKNGDTIAFGGNHFVYTVALEGAEDQDLKTSDPISYSTNKIDQVHPESAKTTFVASATSFLDIFCIDEEKASNQPEKGEENSSASAQSPQPSAQSQPSKSATPRWFRKAKIFLSEIHNEFSERDPKKQKRFRIILATGTGVLILALGTYLTSDQQQKIEELVEQGHYGKAVSLANEYLEKHPENKEIKNLATESLLKSIMPDWIAQLDKHTFANANEILKQAQYQNQFNSDLLSMLKLLDWIVDMEEFIYKRGGLDTPIIIYKHEDSINALVERWDAERTSNRRLMTHILTLVPEFESVYNQTFSSLRTLQNEKATYLTALEKLKVTIKEKLDSNKTKELKSILREFSDKYPHIAGIENLQSDLEKYLMIQADIGNTNPIRLSKKMTMLALTTPPFKEKLAKLQAAVMPPPKINEQFQQAYEAWQLGQIRQSLSLLKNLNHGEWAELAAQKLQRNTQILRNFLTLKEAQESDNYREHLFTFYNSLDPEEDVYFSRLLADDFQYHKEKALAKAQQTIAKAQKQWSTYLEEGRIQGIHRLETTISDTFRVQSRLLTQAHNHLAEVMHTYNLIQLDFPAEAKTLYQKIIREIRLQRQSLRELSMVLDHALLEAKLKLIVEPSYSNQ